MNTIHVAMIIHSYYPIVGGAERQLQALIPYLRSYNIQACILTRRYPGLSAYEIVEGTPVYRLPATGIKPFAALSFISSAVWKIKHLQPDLIHAYDLMSPTSAALLAKKFFKIPVAAKVLSGGIKGDIDRIRHRRGGFVRLKTLARDVDKFIVISQEIADELTSIGATKNKFAFIPNGVDLEKYSPTSPEKKKKLRQELNLPVDVLIVLFVGRIIPEKRPEHLINIWQEIHTAYPKSLLIMVGDGSEADRLKAIKTEGVFFTGTQEDVRPYLQAADIFVLPSAREGLSNALLEAQACGLPVISTSIGAAPEMIENNKSGFLVGVDNIVELKTTIMQLLGNATLRSKLAIAGRETVVQKFSLQKTAKQLAELYRELAAKRK